MERVPGLTQWFAFEERELVRAAVPHLRELKVQEFRTLFSWADWTRDGGQEWLDFVTETLSQVEGLRLLPSLFYTPPGIARKDKEGKQHTSYPPEDLSSYAQFVSAVVERYGNTFDWIQLWNEPNWKPYWDSDMDPSGELFAKMALEAAKVCKAQNKKVVLGGTAPLDYAWHARMDELGLLAYTDAVAFHYAPSWEDQHRRWYPLNTEIGALRALLKGLGRSCEVWLDECGISTFEKDPHKKAAQEKRQIDFFDEVRAFKVDRAYWYCLFDQDKKIQTDDTINTGAPPDDVAYHFGLVGQDGARKPLFQHWKEAVKK